MTVAAWRAIRSVMLVGLVIGVPVCAQAQGRSGVGVVTTLVGEATVARAASAQPQDLRMRDNVFALDRIITKERSMVHVLMGGKALLTVRELSVVTVTEEGGRATVELQSGKVGLAVVRERMKPGDVIEVHTPHAVAAVRGTVLVVEIVPSPAGGELDTDGAFTNVHLLHGKLDVSLRSNPGGAPVRLESLQTVTVTRDVLGRMRPLDLATAGEVTTGLKPNQQAVTAIPEKLQAAVDQRQGVLALATAMELARGGQSSDSAKARSGKVEQTGIAKVVEGGATLDALAPVAEVGEGAGVLVGGVFGALDGTVSSLGISGSSSTGSGSTSSGSGSGGLSGGLSSLGSALGTVGGTTLGGSGSGGGGIGGGGGFGNSGPGSGPGGGKGPSLGSGSGPIGNILVPVAAPLFKKK
jgi:hypothetical protein